MNLRLSPIEDKAHFSVQRSHSHPCSDNRQSDVCTRQSRSSHVSIQFAERKVPFEAAGEKGERRVNEEGESRLLVKFLGTNYLRAG